MKKMFLTLAVMAVAAVGVSSAHAGVRFSIGIPAPVVSYGYRAPVVYAAPRVVYAQPAPVYYAPAPAYCAPAPAYYAPAPVYCPPPVCYTPAPVVRFGFGFGHFNRHGRW